VDKVPHVIKIPSAKPLFTPQLCWALLYYLYMKLWELVKHFAFGSWLSL